MPPSAFRMWPALLALVFLAAATAANAAVSANNTSSSLSFTEDGATQTVNLDNHFSGAISYAIDSESDPDNFITIGVAGNTLSVTPNPDSNGSASFVIQASDGSDSDTKSFSVAITAVADIASDTFPVNPSPTFTGDDEDVDATLDVLANDSFEGSTLTVTIVAGSGPSHGSATVNGDNTILYSPDDDYFGGDSFTYQVASGGTTETATVNLTVDSVNDPPEITTTSPGTPVEFNDGAANLGETVSSAAIFTSASVTDVDLDGTVVDPNQDGVTLSFLLTPTYAGATLVSPPSDLRVVQKTDTSGIPIAGEYQVEHDTGGGSWTTTLDLSHASAALAIVAAVADKDEFVPGTHTITVTASVEDVTSTQYQTFVVTDDGTASLTSVNDAPVIVDLGGQAPTPPLEVDILTSTTVNPIALLGLQVQDFDAGIGGQIASQTLTTTATLSPGGGVFTTETSNIVISNGGLTATISNKTATETSSILASSLRYQAPETVASGGASDTLTLSFNDGIAAAVSTDITVNVTPPRTSPNILGALTSQPARDDRSLFVFDKVTVLGSAAKTRVKIVGTDPTSSTATGEYGALRYTGTPLDSSILTLTTDTANGDRVMTITIDAPPSEATSILRRIAFDPTPDVVAASTQISFRIDLLAADNTELGSDTTSSVQLAPVNDPPQILVVNGSLPPVDDNTIDVDVFNGIQIVDLDAGSMLDLTIELSTSIGPAGVLTGNNIVAATASDTYTATGTPLDLQGFLRAARYTPANNAILPNLAQVVTFRITAIDGSGAPPEVERLQAVDDTTRQPVFSRNDAPTITGSTPATSSSLSINLFASITIDDAEKNAGESPEPLVVTIDFTNPSLGAITNAAANNFVQINNGRYRTSGSPADITTAIQNLEYELDPAASAAGGNLGVPVEYAITATDAPGAITETIRLTPSDPGDATRTTVFLTNQKVWVVDQLASGSGDTLVDVLKNGDLADSDIIVIAPSPDAVPGVIALSEPAIIDKNLTIIGPGADLLKIVPGWSDPAVGGSGSLFQVGSSRLQISGVTIADGVAASRGGAVDVRAGGELVIVDCEILNCSSRVAGGGIAVREGSLTVLRCTFSGNFTSPSARIGGGAISAETNEPVSIVNSTFYANNQLGGGAFGGGALYFENTTLTRNFNAHVLNCSFSLNTDAAEHASSIFANVARTIVSVENCVFQDGSGQTLDTSGAATIDSLGGNITDDDATASLSQEGGAADLVFLDFVDSDSTAPDSSDLLETDALLGNLRDNGGTVRSLAIAPGTAADGIATASAPGTDGRSVIRDATPDSGAHEADTFARLIINEIAPNCPNGPYVEIYNPRDSEAVAINGFKIRTGGDTYTITGISPAGMLPGIGVAITDGGGTRFTLDPTGATVELLSPDDKVIHSVSYLDDFSTTGGAVMPVDPEQSFVRATEFSIGGMLPHLFVSRQKLISEGLDPITALNKSVSSTGVPLDVTGVPLDGTNAPPVARDDDLDGFDEDTPAFVDVIANDIERDRLDTLLVESILAADPGVAPSLSIAGDNTGIDFDPTTPNNPIQMLREGQLEQYTFSYVIQDYGGSPLVPIPENYDVDKATADVTITVLGINDAPVATDDVVPDDPLTSADDVTEDSRIAIFADAAIPVDFPTDPANNPVFDFHPFLGQVDIAPIWLLELDDDIDNDNDNTDLEVVGLEAVGVLDGESHCGARVTLDIRDNRSETHIRYSPRDSQILDALAEGQSVVDTFSYIIRDRHGATSMATVSVTVHGVNDGPGANPDSFLATEGTISVWDNDLFVDNDTDPDSGIHSGATVTGAGDFLTVTAITNSAGTTSNLSDMGASVTVDSTGSVTYDPVDAPAIEALRRGENATDFFTYTVIDKNGATESALVSVLLTGINDTPFADNDVYTIDEDSLLSVPANLGLLLGDGDIDIDGNFPDDVLRVLEASLLSDPTGAQVEIATDGSFTFDPTSNPAFDSLIEGEIQTETFTYTVIDNSYLYAVDDTFTVAQDSIAISLPILVNDAPVHDPSIPFSIVAVGPGNRGGTVSLVTEIGDDGADVGVGITYEPLATFVGTESFVYEIADGLGGYDTATVTIKVVNDALNGDLVANPDSFIVGPSAAAPDAPAAVLDVLVNDGQLPDPGAPLSVLSTSIPGEAVPSEDGLSILYKPSSTTPQNQSFTYTISGGGTATATATVTVDIIANNLTLNSDHFTVTGSGQTLDVLANDGFRPGSSGLTIEPTLTGTHAGDFAVSEDGLTVTFTGAFPFTTAKSFDYTATDTTGGTATTTVTVSGGGSILEATADIYTLGTLAGDEESGYVLDVLTNDTAFPAGSSLGITGIGLDLNLPEHGIAEIVGNTIVYTPDPDHAGSDEFTYEINADGGLERSSTTVTINVVDRRNQLNPLADSFSVSIDSSGVPLDVLANDLPLPPTGETWTILPDLDIAPSNGTAIVSPDGLAILFTPDAGFIGMDSLTYTVDDGRGGTGSALVTIEVGDLPLNPDHFVVLEDSTANLLDVLSNDNVLPATGATYDLTSATVSGGTISIVPLPGDAPQPNAIEFTPAAGFVGHVTIDYFVTDDSGRDVSGTAVVEVIAKTGDRATATGIVHVIGVNDPPVITGVGGSGATFDILDTGNAFPFDGISITDADQGGSQLLRVIITLSDPTKGLLVGDFAERSGGAYFLEGTPAEISAALQALEFIPTQNVVAVGSTDPVVFSISVDDGYAENPTTDDGTIVNITAVNDPPTLFGTVDALTVYYQSSLLPYAGVTIGEIDNNGQQPLTVTISIDDPAKGFFTNLSGFIQDPASPGTYSITSNAVTATTAIRNLLFVPTPDGRVTAGSPEVSTLNLTVTDGIDTVANPAPTTIEVLHSFVQQLGGTESTSNDEFAYAVDLSRDTLVVGAPEAGVGGAAYVFVRQPSLPASWAQVARLVASDASSADGFGSDVAISGDTIAVGAPFEDTQSSNAGAVYIFQRASSTSSTWLFAKKLVASNGRRDDHFGHSLDIDGDSLVVGAPQRKRSQSESGAAYVFGRNAGGTDQWGELEMLQSDTPENFEQFGFSVAISGSTILVGARIDNTKALRAGAAYVFEGSPGGWGGSQHKITPDDGQKFDLFGSSVALDQDLAIVGAPYDDDLGSNSGSAYIFGRNTGGSNQWGEIVKLTAPDGREGDQFGQSVGIAIASNGTRAVVGMPHDGSLDDFDEDDTNNESRLGAAYVFDQDAGGAATWGMIEKLKQPDRDNNDEYGFDVTIDAHTVAVGAPFADDGIPEHTTTQNSQPGSAFIHQLKFNNAPVARTPGEFVETIEERPFTYEVAPLFGDPDPGDVPFFTLSPLPAWLNFNTVSGSVDGTPGDGDLGPHLATVSATDEDSASGSLPLTITVLPGGPFLQTGIVNGIGSTTWTGVTLDRNYAELVVIATPVYDQGSPPLVTRVNIDASNHFEISVARADGSSDPVTGVSVHFIAAEVGIYTQAAHGVTMEVRREISTTTDSEDAFTGSSVGYQQAYQSPVVLGQVQTALDPNWSVFWASGATASEPPSNSILRIGKHVGQDPNTARSPEILGFIAIETGTGQMRTSDGLRGFLAGTFLPSFVSGQTSFPAVDFSANPPVAFDDGGTEANDEGTSTTSLGGSGIGLSHNAWKSVALPYSVTPNTVLEFDFLTTSEAEIHGLGIDVASSPNLDLFFQLAGVDTFGNQDFAALFPGDFSFKHYVIPLGDYLTGAIDHLVFTADNDDPQSATIGIGDSYFANVVIREADFSGFNYRIDLAQPTTAVLSSAGMPTPGGSWPVLFGSGVGLAGIEIAVDQDGFGDPRRYSAPTQVSYVVFGDSSGSIPITDPLPSHYDTWLAERFSPEQLANPALEPSLWGAGADPDHNGRGNLLDYALASDGAHLLEIELDANGDTLLKFRRRSGDPELRTSVEFSVGQPVMWSQLGGSLVRERASNDGNGYDDVTVTVKTSQIFAENILFRLSVGYRTE